MSRRASSGSTLSSSSIEPRRSAKSAVTCFRSPSSEAREASIFVARCEGVKAAGGAIFGLERRSAVAAEPRGGASLRPAGRAAALEPDAAGFAEGGALERGRLTTGAVHAAAAPHPRAPDRRDATVIQTPAL